jgi:RNA polymerase sigma factor (TIGR02999 family)
MTDVTRLLSAIDQGDAKAAEQLLPLVYDELRKLAAEKMAREKPGQTLQATALVHEAYVRLVDRKSADSSDEPRWDNRGHFFSAAAEAMRRILVENARHKQRSKHGGGLQRVDFDVDSLAAHGPADDLLALDEALKALGQKDPQIARLIELHCFAGLSIKEAAGCLGISERTAYRDWGWGQAWLYRAIRGNDRE